MIYTVTFNPALDYVIHAGNLRLGEVNRTTREELYYGGKGINVSTVLHRLGVESVALGFTAGFTGKALAEGVHSLGVKTDFIDLPAGMTRINVKIKAAAETDINGTGPEIPAEALTALFAKLDRLTENDILCLAGSVPASMPGDTYEQILARVSKKGVRCVVDATGDLLNNVLKYHPFLIKPNHHELGEIFGRTLGNTEEIAACAKELQRRGAENVLVSMAGDGALLADADGAVHQIGVPHGTVKNSVGAGDSMVAGFLAGYLAEKDYGYALRLGTAAGSATAFSDGLAERADVEELLRTI